MLYALVLQNPLFIARFNSLPPQNGGQIRVTPFLPGNPSPPWGTTGLAYTCGGAGPGALQIANNGQGAITIVSMSLTYGGATYATSGPNCSIAPGTAVISITALGAPAAGQNTQYEGYVATSDGTQLRFSGVWT